MISVVIPAFNEELVLGATVASLRPVLENLCGDVWEIILVDDGSRDATAEVAGRLAGDPHLRVLRHGRNQGKGAAVRTGVLETRGDLVLVCDADGSTSAQHLAEFVREVASGADIVIGDRRGPGATVERRQTRLRRFLGSAYIHLLRYVTNTHFMDYNCGFKLFRGEVARALLARCGSRRWVWDGEVIALASKRDLRIREVPVRWGQGPRSQVRPLRDATTSLGELVSLWWRTRTRKGAFGRER